MRRLLRTRARWLTSPLPSILGGRVSRRTTWGCCRRSSAVSSIVTIRWLAGMALDKMLSSVVLPLPVPPEIRMLSLERTMAVSKSIMPGVRDLFSSKSETFSGTAGKRRTESTGPSMAKGGMTALTREPSGSRASTMGLPSSIWRPILETILSMIFIRCGASVNLTLVSSSKPPRSMYTCLGPLTKMSEMPGSASKGSIGPKPITSFCMSSIIWRCSLRLSTALFSDSICSTRVANCSRRRCKGMLLSALRSTRLIRSLCSLVRRPM